MDDVTLVQVIETSQDLSDPIPNKRLFEGAVVAQERGDGTTGNVFQENVEMVFINT